MKKNGSVAFKIDIMLVAQGPPFLSEEIEAQEGSGGDALPQVQPQDHPPSPTPPVPPGSVLLRGSQELPGGHAQHLHGERPGLRPAYRAPREPEAPVPAQASAGTNLLCWASFLTLCPLCPTQTGNGLWALILGPAVAGRTQGFTELSLGSHARDLGTSSYLLQASPVVVTGWLGQPIVVWEMFWNQPFNENKRN